jgi:hypothetical protein
LTMPSRAKEAWVSPGCTLAVMMIAFFSWFIKQCKRNLLSIPMSRLRSPLINSSKFLLYLSLRSEGGIFSRSCRIAYLSRMSFFCYILRCSKYVIERPTFSVIVNCCMSLPPALLHNVEIWQKFFSFSLFLFESIKLFKS